MSAPRIFNYYIIFDTDSSKYSSIIQMSLDDLRLQNQNRTHMLDDDLVGILPAIKYCLHLPRYEFDVCSVEAYLLDDSLNFAHNIILIPSTCTKEIEKMLEPDIIFCDDKCYENTNNVVKSFNQKALIYKVSELNDKLLVDNWLYLYELRNNKNLMNVFEIDVQYLLPDNKIYFLPSLFLKRQYSHDNDSIKNFYMKIFNSNCEFDCLEALYNLYVRNLSLRRMHFEGVRSEEKLNEYRDFYSKNFEINLVLIYYGVPTQQVKYAGLTNSIHENEKKSIDYMAVHRAIAKNAFIMNLGKVPEDLFLELNNLELSCANENGTNNKFIHNEIDKIGKIFERALSDKQKKVFLWSKNIDVFSNFPLGIVKLACAEVPLQLYRQVSHRVLTPVSRGLPNELVNYEQTFLGDDCKILFVETVLNIAQNAGIRACSNALIESIKKSVKENDKMNLFIEEAYDINTFHNIMKKYLSKNVKILIISAHGFYDRQKNISGLMIGNEMWMAGDNDLIVPPIVCLSACHVSPRGNGCVSAGDLFLRCGAKAVLSTLIPIRADKNSLLLCRFINNVSEAIKGKIIYKNLSDAWSGTVASNAVYEMISSSAKLNKWFYMNNVKNGKLFTNNKSVGKLNRATIYTDTAKILAEMLKNDGMDNQFENILFHKDFFPESYFYEWLGSPENFILYDYRK